MAMLSTINAVFPQLLLAPAFVKAKESPVPSFNVQALLTVFLSPGAHAIDIPMILPSVMLHSFSMTVSDHSR